MTATAKQGVYHVNSCPTFQTVDIIGKKWTVPLIQAVNAHGEEGFNKLLRRMGTISPKLLSLRLRELEEQKIVAKKLEKERRKKRITYSLTQKGVDLLRIVKEIKRWNYKYGCTSMDCSEVECATCKNYNP